MPDLLVEHTDPSPQPWSLFCFEWLKSPPPPQDLPASTSNALIKEARAMNRFAKSARVQRTWAGQSLSLICRTGKCTCKGSRSLLRSNSAWKLRGEKVIRTTFRHNVLKYTPPDVAEWQVPSVAASCQEWGLLYVSNIWGGYRLTTPAVR